MLSKEIKFLLTHSSIYGLGTMVAQLVSFLLLPLYTRYLTPSDYGVLETVNVTSGMIGIVMTVGIARALSRFYYASERAEDRNAAVSTTYITFLGLTFLSLPVLFYSSGPLSKILFRTETHGHLFLVSFITLIPGGFIDIGMMYLRLVKKSFIFIALTITRLFCLILLNVFLIVQFKMGITGILYSSLIVSVFYAIFMTGMIFKTTKMQFSFGLSRQIMAYGFPMIFSNLGNTIVKQSDKYFVLSFLSIADLGIYSLALKLGNAIHNLLTVSFNLAYIPRRFEIMDKPDAKDIYSKIFTCYMFAVIYIGLFLSVLIPEILKVLVTPEFMGAKDIIPLVILSMIIFGCHYHFDFGILQSKRTKYLAYVGITCGLIQITLNILLIRRYGLWGAVWSSLIALGIQAALLYLISDKLYRINYEFRRISLYLMIALGFYGISTQIHIHNLLVSLGIKLILLMFFPVAVIISKIITPEEKIRLKEIIANKISSRFLSKALIKTN